MDNTRKLSAPYMLRPTWCHWRQCDPHGILRGISSLCWILEGLDRASGSCISLPGLYLIVASHCSRWRSILCRCRWRGASVTILRAVTSICLDNDSEIILVVFGLARRCCEPWRWVFLASEKLYLCCQPSKTIFFFNNSLSGAVWCGKCGMYGCMSFSCLEITEAIVYLRGGHLCDSVDLLWIGFHAFFA